MGAVGKEWRVRAVGAEPSLAAARAGSGERHVVLDCLIGNRLNVLRGFSKRCIFPETYSLFVT
jgi:hypothetical protein